MIEPLEYRPILERLLEKTRAGRVPWEAVGGSEFRCTLDEYGFYVWQDEDGYGFRVEDSSGRTLLASRANREILFTSSEEKQMFERFSDLYELARRRALNVPESLANVAELLDKI